MAQFPNQLTVVGGRGVGLKLECPERGVFALYLHGMPDSHSKLWSLPCSGTTSQEHSHDSTHFQT